MSDGLSLWDILLLKDEITVGEWVLLSWVLPAVIVGVMIVGVLIYGYWDDIVYGIRHLFRRKR